MLFVLLNIFITGQDLIFFLNIIFRLKTFVLIKNIFIMKTRKLYIFIFLEYYKYTVKYVRDLQEWDPDASERTIVVYLQDID